MLTIKNISTALLTAYNTLDSIAQSKGHTIRTLSVDVNRSDVTQGLIVGTVTVANRSRRSFKLIHDGLTTNITLLGETRKIAA